MSKMKNKIYQIIELIADEHVHGGIEEIAHLANVDVEMVEFVIAEYQEEIAEVQSWATA